MKIMITSLVAIALISNAAFAQQHQHQDQQKQESKLTDADRLQIAVQGICPVTGEQLGSMGEPVKVKIGQQHAFLCCKGCMGKQLQAEDWQTVQTNIAAAQGTCPIMEKPVKASMKSTVVNGQLIFVCCPPCIEKIQADPKTALTKVTANNVAYVAAKNDRFQIAAQGICPVSGKKLGSMGAPIKVKVGEQHAFLCCKGCLGKQINAEHWRTVQANLAKNHGHDHDSHDHNH